MFIHHFFHCFITAAAASSLQSVGSSKIYSYCIGNFVLQETQRIRKYGISLLSKHFYLYCLNVSFNLGDKRTSRNADTSGYWWGDGDGEDGNIKVSSDKRFQIEYFIINSNPVYSIDQWFICQNSECLSLIILVIHFK